MDSSLIIMIAAFVGVAALVGSIAYVFRGSGEGEAEDRLDILTGAAKPKGSGSAELGEGVLARPLDERIGSVEAFIAKVFNLSLLLEQADAPISTTRFLIASAVLAGLGFVAPLASGMSIMVAPIGAVVGGILPLVWMLLRRRRRFRKFAAQLSDALELISRALRAGHSLPAGLQLVGEEMSPPLSTEFMRVFDEQNLGIPMEEALELMTERIPNLDLRFFVTAVILQRQTGGDLAEILDKIGRLIRERFAIWGQVQALTGEGRLSGIVLLALPPLLFLAVYKLNPDYVTVLFTDPMGKQMLIGAAVMQFLGALVIRKIVNIKV